VKRDVDERPIFVPGFGFGAAACGIKASGLPDVAIVACERPATAAATFTRNRFAAAPVTVARERLRANRLQAIVVNSGNANACTGRRGLADAHHACALAARALKVPPGLVAPASTGIIGTPLPRRELELGIAAAAVSIAPDGLWRFARAIMTSDAFPKVSTTTVTVGRQRVMVAAIAKGAGMIAPDLATLLVFLLTDAVIAPAAAKAIVRAVSAEAFNGLSVDGDTSTNDSLFLLASGAAGNPGAKAGSPAARAIERAATEVGVDLARQVAADGEGATKLVTIEVGGAPSPAAARKVARAVGSSTLVKTAFFGGDPNWGRIACAIGASGVPIDPERVTIRLGRAVVFRRGLGVEAGRVSAREAMAGQEITVRIDLGGGSSRGRLITSDLSHDYVEFNSAYTT
jgi:glutamate N-acetyltransferase / amino-acid N-acetyltransferase